MLQFLLLKLTNVESTSSGPGAHTDNSSSICHYQDNELSLLGHFYPSTNLGISSLENWHHSGTIWIKARMDQSAKSDYSAVHKGSVEEKTWVINWIPKKYLI